MDGAGRRDAQEVGDVVNGGAWLSTCEQYRYALLRLIDLGLDGLDGKQDRSLNVVMLNPSTATATEDDPTIRRCIGYARRWGYGELIVTNLFAYRATDPKAMKVAADPVGPENDEYIRKIAQEADLILVAWGSHGAYRRRDEHVRRLIASVGKEPLCLAITATGQPVHPLYQRADLEPIPYRRPVNPDQEVAHAHAADRVAEGEGRGAATVQTTGYAYLPRVQRTGGASVERDGIGAGPRPDTAQTHE